MHCSAVIALLVVCYYADHEYIGLWGQFWQRCIATVNRVLAAGVLMDFRSCNWQWPRRGVFAIVSGLILAVCLVGCVLHDDIYITISDAAISANTIVDVKDVLRDMGLEEVRSDPSYRSENLHFINSDVADYYNVFIPPLNKKPWRLRVVVAGRSSFSEYQKQMYNKLVVNLQEKFGKQNVVADVHSRSGQKLLSGNLNQ